MLEEQGGGCAICGRRPNPKRRLDIDHHHGDMRVRGLLCVPCNRALRDWMTLMWFQSATQYLENPPADWVNDLL